jgi:hypothetical protein
VKKPAASIKTSLSPQFRLLVETTRFEANCALLKRSEEAVEVCFV